MATNVFGTPITTETLEGLPEYAGKLIRRIDRAHVALGMSNADDKNTEAVAYVNSLKSKYGHGASALCVFYNATGDTINFVKDKSWHSSHIWNVAYPSQVANGQWGAFLHVHHTAFPTGAIGAAVYRGKNEDDTEIDYMMAWSVPWDTSSNSVYTMVRQAGYFDDSKWNDIEKELLNSGKYETSDQYGGLSTVSIGGGSSPQFDAQLTLTGASDAQPVDPPSTSN